MSQEDCGCTGGKSGAKPDFYLQAASPKTASTCGEGQTLGDANANCLLSESTFDRILGPYTIPVLNTSTPVQVCNGALYTVGLWVQLGIDGSTLQIVSIVGNALHLKNGCPNNAPIKGNSNPGTIVPTNTPLVIVGEPECLTEEEAMNELLSALSGTKSLCMPSLEKEASSTSEMHLLGWRKADSDNADFKKCIQWLANIWMKGAALFIKPIADAPAASTPDAANWRRMAIHKTTGEVRQQLNDTEDPNFKKTFGLVPLFEQLYKNYTGAMEDENLWVNIPHATPLTQTINLSIASINALPLPDTFYVSINVNIGVDQAAGYAHQAVLEINSGKKGLVGCAGGPEMNCISLIVPVTKADKKIELKVTTKGGPGTPKCHVTVDLLGVYI